MMKEEEWLLKVGIKKKGKEEMSEKQETVNSANKNRNTGKSLKSI